MNLVLWLLLATSSQAAGPDALRAALDAGTTPESWGQARTALVADPQVTDVQLLALAADPDWRLALTAAALRVWRQDPSTARDVWQATPGRSRNGRPVFMGAVHPGAGPIIAERLVHGGDATDDRIALVDWLRRSDADFAPWLAGALEAEPDAAVRVGLVDALRYGAGPGVAAAQARALDDPDPSVRAAGVRSVGHTQTRSLVPQLLSATADPDHDVAGLAARSLGWMGHEAGFDAVAAVLLRPDPQARLYALRALQRLDATRAASSPAVLARHEDPDPRVARAARQIAPR